MARVQTLSWIAGGLGIIACPIPGLSKDAANDGRNNIILIITDQQTADAMSCVGNNDLNTPGMDMLAEDGILFSRSYVSYPLSGPSRASLMTGKYPVEIGVKDNQNTFDYKHLENSIGVRLKESGYDCLYAGKWHVAVEEINLPQHVETGFIKISDMDDPNLVENCVPHLEQKRDNPLFLVASFLNPHEICEYARFQFLPTGNIAEPAIEDCPQLPYNAAIPAYYPEAVLLNRQADPRSYPTASYSDDDWRRYLNAYYRLVERVDAEIVKLIDQLKKNNLYENSLILFVSDHGDAVGAHRGNQKRTLQEEVIRVPFIVKVPKSKNKNIINDEALINTSLDIYQTIADYAGIGEDKSLQGKSVRPIVEGKVKTLHEEIYIETLLNGVNTRGWAVIGKDFKYVLYRNFRNNEQLFDLKTDSYEMKNLAVDKAYNKDLLKFRTKLYNWALNNNDRMLKNLLRYTEKE